MNMKEKNIPINISGIAGEYFVAAELSRLGFIASLTLKNTQGIDILVSTRETDKSFAIQVKTTQGKKKEWMLNEKSENLKGKNFLYVFVRLKELGELPEFHIVPSKIVAKNIKEDHQNWLSTLGKKGQKRNDSKMRKFRDYEDKYLGKWDLLCVN
ncbi:MAG: hypothetical protein L6Q33_00450 [Bacteriovoracaceae bacterium]|nr:hypothetical protein [Bacteriovoracaceae bacterium]